MYKTSGENLPRGKEPHNGRKTLCIVPCGRKKVWSRHGAGKLGLMPARFAYIGSKTMMMHQWANDTYPNNWFILSAKYGLLPPNECIEDYDVTWDSPGSILQYDLSFQVVILGLSERNIIITTCQNGYLTRLRNTFPQAAIAESNQWREHS